MRRFSTLLPLHPESVMSTSSFSITQPGYLAPYYVYPQVPHPHPHPKIAVPSNSGALLIPFSATYPAPQQLVPGSLSATPAFQDTMYITPSPQPCFIATSAPQMSRQQGYIVSPFIAYFPVSKIPPAPNLQQNPQSYMHSLTQQNHAMKQRRRWTDDDIIALLEETNGKNSVYEINWKLVLTLVPSRTIPQLKQKWLYLRKHGINTVDDFLKVPSTKKNQHFEKWLQSNLVKDKPTVRVTEQKSSERVTEHSDEYTVISWMDPSSSEEEAMELVETAPEQIDSNHPANIVDDDKFVASFLN